MNETTLKLEVIQSDLDEGISKHFFKWNVTRIGQLTMTIQLSFENAIWISTSANRDKLKITVLDGSKFMSTATRQVMVNDTEVEESIPPQLPDNSITESLE